MDFSDILRSRMEGYVPFKGKIIQDRKPASLAESIRMARREGRNPVIAEIKPASPITGAMRKIDDPADMANAFKKNGACGISVLTEPKYFGGSLESLKKARCGLPILRKDFIFHPSQIRESYAYGADSVLIIASFFDEDRLAQMIRESRSLGMEPLVEIHSKDDIGKAASSGAMLYAINNRDKDTMKVDLTRTESLAPHINGIKVSASGIETPGQLKRALEYCDAALVGGALMRHPEPDKALRELVYGGL